MPVSRTKDSNNSDGRPTNRPTKARGCWEKVAKLVFARYSYTSILACVFQVGALSKISTAVKVVT